MAQSPAPEPTPTLVPALTNPAVTDTEHITISLQTEQAAEFGLFVFYQTQNNTAQIAQLARTIDAIAATTTLTDPVVAIDMLPSSNQFAVRREFSYGEITAGLALIALFLLQLVRFIWNASRPPTYWTLTKDFRSLVSSDVIEEFGLVYAGAVALALVLAVAAFLLNWSMFSIPMWIVFAVVGIVGALGIVGKAVPDNRRLTLARNQGTMMLGLLPALDSSGRNSGWTWPKFEAAGFPADEAADDIPVCSDAEVSLDLLEFLGLFHRQHSVDELLAIILIAHECLPE